MTGTLSAADVAIGLVMALLGYMAGSLPASPAIGSLAGIDLSAHDGDDPGAGNVWRLAGPGWGLLALVANLAQGIVPVALAAVTFSWAAGWAAGVGAVAGAAWPMLGRLPGGRGVGVLAGVAFALEPAAAVLALIPCIVVAGAARVARRSGGVAVVVIGLGSYLLLFAAAERDVSRLLVVLALYAITAARSAVTARAH